MNSLAVSVGWKNGEARFHFLLCGGVRASRGGGGGGWGGGGGGYLGRFLVGM